MSSVKKAALAAALGLFALTANAATLQLDFDFDFSDPLDPNSELPDGPAPYATAVFDDQGSAGTVVLTISVAGTVGAADVGSVYLNSDVGGLSFSVIDDSAVTSSSISYSSNTYQAGNDGQFDIFIDLPPPGSDRLSAGESISFLISGAGITANTFNSLSNPTPESLTGPFLGAMQFLDTGQCEIVNGECTYPNSAWVAAVPIPAAVWLFGSAIAGLGFMKRKRAA